MTTHWVRFAHDGAQGFGMLEGGQIQVYEGSMFSGARPTGQLVPLGATRLLMPVVPTKVIALWNNFHALGEKLSLPTPTEPLYLLKSPNSFLEPGGVIRHPGCEGKVVFEGELAVVIGKTCKRVSEREALDHVLGYTCLNDVTAADILHRDASFAQWVRAKGFDTFCPFGPSVVTGLDPATLVVRTLLDGVERQHYPISDMRFSVQQLVSLISQDMTLHPGDLIACGTSVGVGSMKPGSTVEVVIEGVGTLTNRFL
ncbi:MAG: fumarylacetoacetate hydrolase family protein [Pseudomonadota bacterium]